MFFGQHHRVEHREGESPFQSKKFCAFVNDAVYFFGGFAVIVVIPQIMNVWIYKKIDGVSPITWAGFLLASLFWVFYGIIHKEKQIIVINALGFFMNFLVILGLILSYGKII